VPSPAVVPPLALVPLPVNRTNALSSLSIGNDHVPVILPFSAVDVAGDRSGVVLGLQARDFVRSGPGAGELDECQRVASAVADVNRLLLLGFSAFALAGGLGLGGGDGGCESEEGERKDRAP
jgi:hypothetical protein